MTPKNQYLRLDSDPAIVSKAKKMSKAENILLPFEEDPMLSVILGKALLLAADDKITDQAILQQIDDL